jgi:hypothetical protein
MGRDDAARLVAEVRGLVPKDGALTVLTVPSDYRQAHLFPNALQDDVRETGRLLATVTTCALVHPLSLSDGSVTVNRLTGVRSSGTAYFNGRDVLSVADTTY